MSPTSMRLSARSLGLIVDHTAHGLPTVTGFVDTFVMAAVFLVVCVLAGLLIPGRRVASGALVLDGHLATNPESG